MPKVTYGKEECEFLHDKVKRYDEYFFCLQLNGIKVTLKDFCGTSEYDKPEDKRLRCYQGKEIKEFGIVPYDQSYCEYENRILNGTVDQLFSCYKSKANLKMEKHLCDRLHLFKVNETSYEKLPD